MRWAISRTLWFVREDENLYLLPVTGSDSQCYKNVLKTPRNIESHYPKCDVAVEVVGEHGLGSAARDREKAASCSRP